MKDTEARKCLQYTTRSCVIVSPSLTQEHTHTHNAVLGPSLSLFLTHTHTHTHRHTHTRAQNSVFEQSIANIKIITKHTDLLIQKRHIVIAKSELCHNKDSVPIDWHDMIDRLQRFELKFFACVLLKKQSHLHLRCPGGKQIDITFSFLVELSF